MRDSNKTLLTKEILEHIVHTPTTHTHIHTTNVTTPLSVVDLKKKVKVRVMRNRMGSRRLNSIYIEYKEQKINTQNTNNHK